MKISHSTGHVTCDSDYMTPGDYSVMIVVKDAISGIRVSLILIREQFSILIYTSVPSLPNISYTVFNSNVYYRGQLYDTVNESLFFHQTVSELMIRVKSPVDNVLPTILPPHPLLPLPPLIFTPNNTSHTFSLYDADTVMGLELQTLSGLPEGAELSELSIKGANSGIYIILCMWSTE